MVTRCAAIASIDSFRQRFGEEPTILFFVSMTIFCAVIVDFLLTKVLKAHLKDVGIRALSLLTGIIRAVIVAAVVFFLGENVFSIKMSGMVEALGITTLVISLGLQDLIKSIVAGILIVAGDIVAVGDQIILGEHRGEVMDINWHQITLRDRDGIAHIMPNSTLMNGNFMRAKGKMACRHIFECDIAPGVDLNLVKTDIETRAAQVLTKHGWIAPGYNPQVLFLGSSAFGTSASVRVFISDIEYATRAMDAVMIAISDRGYLADCTHEVSPAWKRGRALQWSNTDE